MNRYILVCLFLCFFFMLLLNFGSTKADTISNLIADFTTLNEKGKISDNFLNNVTRWANTYLYPNQERPYIIGFSTSGSSTSPSNAFVILFNASATNIHNSTSTPYNWESTPYRSIDIYRNNLEWSGNTTNTNTGGINLNQVTWEYAYTTIDINTNSLRLNAYEEYGGSYLTASFTFTPIKDEVVTIDNIQGVNAKKNIYQYADVTLGKVEEYLEENRFTLMELTQDNNLVAFVKYNNVSKQIINSSYMGIEVADNTDPPYDLIRVNNWRLYLNQIYTLNIYNGDENVSNSSYSDKQTFNYIFLKSNSIITNGVITYYGSGDGFTSQDSTNAIIDNTNQNKGFWENAYNNLFVLDSGDVNDIYATIESKFPSGDSPMVLYNQLFDLFSEEPGDFIIEWDNVPVNLTIRNGDTLVSGDVIPAGLINFNQLCRDNATMGIIKFWLNTIFSLSFYLLFFFEFYRCILRILGVSTEVVNGDEDEVNVIDSVRDSYTVNKSTGEVKVKDTLFSHTSYRKR